MEILGFRILKIRIFVVLFEGDWGLFEREGSPHDSWWQKQGKNGRLM